MSSTRNDLLEKILAATNGDTPDGAVLKTQLGWEFTLDTQYTSEAPLSVQADTWTPVPNNGFILPVDNIVNYPDGVASFYDAVTQRVYPDTLNGFDGITIAFGIRPLAANSIVRLRGYLATPGDFFPQQEQLLNANAGSNNSPVFFSVFPVTPNSLANGVRYEVQCSTDCELYLGSMTFVKVSQK